MLDRHVDWLLFCLFFVFSTRCDKIKVCKGKKKEEPTSIIFGAGGLTGIGGAFISHKSPFIGISVCVVVGVGVATQMSSSIGDD